MEINDVKYKNIEIILDALLGNTDKTFNFDEIFEKGELYKAYINTANINIKFIGNANSDIEGGYNSKNNTIYINRKKFADFYSGRDRASIIRESASLSGLRRLFVHELEHFVQNEEGFSKGGNTSNETKVSFACAKCAVTCIY
jgi:hypothetical protein